MQRSPSIPAPARFGAAKAKNADLTSDDFPADRFEVRRIRGREAMSQLYRFEVQLVAHEGAEAVDPDDMAGARVKIVLTDRDGAFVRAIHGMVASVKQTASEGARERPSYELEVVPRAWQLALVTTQEIFLDMTVPEIIRAKLDRYNLQGYGELRLLGDYPRREFVVQYKESDIAFVSRLCEHLGISFFFVHGADRESMVFVDQQGGFLGTGGATVQFSAGGEADGVYRLATECRVTPGTFVVQDYNHRHPELDLVAIHQTDQGFGGGMLEYGTHHKTPAEGKALAQIRAEEALSRRRVYDGQSAIAEFTPGLRFRLDETPYPKHAELLLTEVVHQFERPLGGDASAEQGYHNSFTAVPGTINYRPPRVTPRPRVSGVLTATVQAGNEIKVGSQSRIDDRGSYVVEFHFDTAPPDQKASRPVRMAQPFGGPQQGMHFPLRPGTEVVIAFVDGDPDRPIIVGAVPNAMTPSTVSAADSHMHRIRSRHGLVIEFGTSGNSG